MVEGGKIRKVGGNRVRQRLSKNIYETRIMFFTLGILGNLTSPHRFGHTE